MNAFAIVEAPTDAVVRDGAKRLGQIDALRGLAAIAVLVHHYTVSGLDAEGRSGGFIDGKYGVHIFFMISGFVILMTAMRQTRVSDFLWGRFARLFPAYWAAIGVALIAVYGSGKIPNRELSAGDVLLNVTMLQSAFNRPHVNGSFWTLYVELLFYVCISLAIAVGRIRRLPWWLAAAVLIDTLAIFPQAWDRVPGWWRLANIFPLLRHLYLFTFGVWLFRARTCGVAALVPIAILCLFNAYGRGLDLHGLVIVTVLGGILSAAAFGKLTWIESHWLVGLGTISYSLYLVHENVGYAMIRSLVGQAWPLWASQVAATVASLVLAIALTFLVERPAHGALRRWWSHRDGRAEPVTQEPVRLESQGAGV